VWRAEHLRPGFAPWPLNMTTGLVVLMGSTVASGLPVGSGHGYRREPEVSAAAVVYVKDLDRVAAFYAGVVGLVLDARESDHAVLRTDAFRLILVRMPDALAREIELGDPPVRREDTPIKLVLPVSSLAGARGAAPALGGVVDPVSREWKFKGARVCDGYDPEGNVVQFAESDPSAADGAW
jgi:catechol 2,3-dioxygenase-like lactoylglutathione lyase family enzyme